ncbi:MAG: hypothetical protein KAU35_01330 [candidate division Zixibacteria bacterium]|nr:hypothetical protein [candidate division Zixibacteria bacterium]
MKKIAVLPALLVLAGAGSAQAANFAVIKSPPTLLNFLILIVAVVCMAGSLKVVELIRGGILSKSWQLFLGGFAVLTLAQLATLLNALEIVNLPSFVVPALLILMAGLFLYGVHEAKRTLG